MEIVKHRYIDALRGIAVLGVILVHSGQFARPINPNLIWIFDSGARGVQLFFVLSALTLLMSWNTRFKSEKFVVKTFYVRRFFRVAPMFYVAIVLSLASNGFGARYWAPDGIGPFSIFSTLFFLHGFHPETINSVVPGGWSISVEVVFYAMFPFVISRIKRYSTLLVLFFSSLIFASNHLIIENLFQLKDDKSYLVDNFHFLNFFSQSPVFLIGVFCYLFINSEYDEALFRLVGGAAALSLCLEYLSPTVTIGFMPSHVVAACLFGLFTIFLSTNPLKFFVNRVTVLLGQLSYSMYLLHFFVLHYFSKLGLSAKFHKSDMRSVLHFILVVLVTAVVSFFSYKLVEKPGIKLGYRCIQKITLRVWSPR